MFKKIIVCMFIGLVLSGVILTGSAINDAQIVENSVLRLHVVANSDSKEDQSLKLKVRDAVLDETKIMFTDAKNKSDAMDRAKKYNDKIKNAALNIIHNNNYNYEVEIIVGKQYFPTKEYEGGFRLPAGEYDAVKVIIGKGEGKNWWCVMYPPLCFSGSVKNTNKAKLNDVLKSDSIKFVSYPAAPKVKVKFKIAEVFGKVKNYFKKKK